MHRLLSGSATEFGDCPKNSPRIRGLSPNFVVAAVKNLCIVRARVYRTIPALFLSLIFYSIFPGFLRADSPFDGKVIHSIEIQSDGPLNDISYTDLFNLLELREGDSYSASQAERSIQRLFSTEMFHDVQISVEPADDRVGVKILLSSKILDPGNQARGRRETGQAAAASRACHPIR